MICYYYSIRHTRHAASLQTKRNYKPNVHKSNATTNQKDVSGLARNILLIIDIFLSYLRADKLIDEPLDMISSKAKLLIKHLVRSGSTEVIETEHHAVSSDNLTES